MTDLVLIDVDGVISPYERDLDCDPWGDFKYFQTGFEMRYSEKMLKDLFNLDAEKMWLTTWEEGAAEIIAPVLELPDIKWLPRRTSKGWYKLDWVLELAPMYRKVVWFDDDIKPSHRKQLPDNVLAIRPDPAKGITPAQMVKAQKYLSE